MKQADSYGIFRKMKVGGPIGDLQNFVALPPAARVGYCGIEWYYAWPMVLGKRKSAHQFVADYREKYNEPPTAWSAFGYLGVDMLLGAIDAHKTTMRLRLQRLWKESGSRRRSSTAKRTSAPTIMR